MARIQLRRGTAAEWTAQNPALAAGEVGVETDTLLAKIGDGVTTWTSLSYITPSDLVEQGALDAAVATLVPLTQKAAAGGVATLDGAGTIPDGQIPATIARDTEVSAAIAALVASAPSTLDTLNELAAALGDDQNFATTVTTALAGKQPLDPDLTAIAALSTTAYGRALLALADAAAGRTALGLGTAALSATTDFDAAGAAATAQAASQPLDGDLTAIAALATTSFGRSLLTQADAAAVRTTVGLGTAATHPSTDFDTAGAAAAAQAASQPLDSDLTAIAALATTSFGRSFLDRADAAAARTLLGLGTAALSATTAFDAAGVAATEQARALAAEALLAPLASPTFTGTLVVPSAKVSGKNGLSPRTFTGRSTTTGAPTTGTWAVDDIVRDSAGIDWRCTVAGTPGTWVTDSGAVGAATDQSISGLWKFTTMPQVHAASSDATPIQGRSAADAITVGAWNIVHDGGVGDLFHFTTGPNTAPSRAVVDGVTTSGSPTVTSATAAFSTGSAGGVNSDVGKSITGTGIPAGSYVGVVNSATSIGLSSSATANVPVNATATGSGLALTIGIGDTDGAVIAIGVDQGGTGIITRSKGQGVALHVDCMDTVTAATAYGAYMYHASHIAPFSYWQIAATATTPVVKMAPVSGDTVSTGAKWFELHGNAVGGSDLLGSIYADTGLLDWRRTIQTIAPNSSVTPLIRVADEASTPSEAYLGGKTSGELGMRVYRWTGSGTTAYAYGWVAESSKLRLKVGNGAANKGAEVFTTLIEASCAATPTLAFFGTIDHNLGALKNVGFTENAMKPTNALAETTRRDQNISSALGGLSTGRLLLVACRFALGQSVNNLSFWSGSTPLASGTAQWFALYDSSRHLLGVTSDDTSTAWAANTKKTLTFAFRATDGVTNTDTSFVSATAAFVAGDVGKAIYGAGIPAGTTISSVTNGTTVVLSAATTATATGVTFVLARATPVVIPSTGLYYVAAMVAAGTVPNLKGAASDGILNSENPITAGFADSSLTTPATAPATAIALTTLGLHPYAMAA